MSPFVAVIPLVIIALTALVVALRARRRTRAQKPAREASAFVLLDANAWDACSVDDVREPWSRLATEPIRGFCGVPAGRHRVRTTTTAGDATLDFVVYPGEILAWRLDGDRARWAQHEVEPETRSLLEAAPASTSDLSATLGARPKLPGWLVHLRTTMGVVSSRGSAPPVKADDGGLDRIRKRLVKLVARAQREGDADGELLVAARALGESLIGRPLTRREMRGLAAPAREVADKLAANGQPDRAMCVVGLGLALLPGDPELMVVAGCTLAERGESDEAIRALEAALERDLCLEAEDVARAMRARLELRSRLGRVRA